MTACFALMVGTQGRAVGVEHIPELVCFSTENIQKSVVAPLLEDVSLSMHCGDGREGWLEFAPYDAIVVGVAVQEIPPPLLDPLKGGGKMVIAVVDHIFQQLHLRVVDKNFDGSASIKTEECVRYLLLAIRVVQL